MTASLLNAMMAHDIEKLLTDEHISTYADDERALRKETASAIIHAVLWAYSSRSGSFASCYAFEAMTDALMPILPTIQGLARMRETLEQAQVGKSGG